MAPAPSRSRLVKAGKLESTYRCDHAELLLTFDQFTGTDVSAQLRLRGNVTHENNAAGIRAEPETSPFFISGLVLPSPDREERPSTPTTRSMNC